MPFNSVRHRSEVQQYPEHNFSARTHRVAQLSYLWVCGCHGRREYWYPRDCLPEIIWVMYIIVHFKFRLLMTPTAIHMLSINLTEIKQFSSCSHGHNLRSTRPWAKFTLGVTQLTGCKKPQKMAFFSAVTSQNLRWVWSTCVKTESKQSSCLWKKKKQLYLFSSAS